MNRHGLQQVWSNPDTRRKLIAALRVWNRALQTNAVEQLFEAACKLEKVLQPGSVAGVENVASFSATMQSPAETPRQIIDRLLDFPSCRLAVYGSLAPGKKNHHIMAGMKGTWRRAVLRGSLRNEGWGAGQGFPGFLWDGTDNAVPGQVFASTDLPEHWQRLDDFEGPEYRRILVPAKIDDGEIEVCNVYALAENLTTDEP